MNIDYISDLHIDQNISEAGFDHGFDKIKKKNVRSFIENLCQGKKSDILLVAGDIANSNKTSLDALKELKNHYKNVVVVPGNHDHWVTDEKKFVSGYTSQNRIDELRYGAPKGCKVLYGDIIDIDGVRIGGTTGWNDFSYSQKYTSIKITEDRLNSNWKNGWVDGRFCRDIEVIEKNNSEMTKLYSMFDNVDIIMTHFCPYTDKLHIPERWRESHLTTFFYFDMDKNILNEKKSHPKYWIFGHTHSIIDYEDLRGVKYLCNPHGYKFELYEDPNLGSIKTFEI